MLCEMVLLIFTPIPILEGYVYKEYVHDYGETVAYQINDLLSAINVIKLYHILRYVMYLTRFTTGRSQRVCMMNGLRANLLFALKSIMKDNPFMIVLLAFVTTASMGSYVVMIFERPLLELSGAHFE